MDISPWLIKWGRKVANNPLKWIKLGKFENLILSQELKNCKIHKPIYITGLARSGTTIVLECLNSHSDTKSFTYADFPFVHIPWFWSFFIKRVLSRNKYKLKERAHKDGIFISESSPEAMEEILWMHFHKNLHNPSSSHCLDKNYIHSEFENYYFSCIKKLLFAYKSQRYLAKANYNITRLKYLHRLFPGASFIILIRNPFDHVYSLLKQHRMIKNLQQKNSRILEHFQHVGHFEFGLGRKAINCGNTRDSLEIMNLFESDDVLAYAKQWNVIYSHIHSLMCDKELRDSLFVLKYEELCSKPKVLLNSLFEAVQLENYDSIVSEFSEKLKLPNYYSINFTEEQKNKIYQTTKKTAQLLKYKL